MSRIRIETNYDDWSEAYVYDKKVYEGHDRPNNLLRNVLAALTAPGDVQIVETEFPE